MSGTLGVAEGGALPAGPAGMVASRVFRHPCVARAGELAATDGVVLALVSGLVPLPG